MSDLQKSLDVMKCRIGSDLQQALDEAKRRVEIVGAYQFLPVYVGGYKIGGVHGIQFNLTKKPCALHRLMMRWCFGWEWVGA